MLFRELHLPNARILPHPVTFDVFHHPPDNRRVFFRNLDPPFLCEVVGVDDGTVRVQLELRSRLVSDPDRLAVPITLEVIQGPFRRPLLSVDGVEDFYLSLPDGVLKEPEEPLRLFFVPENVKAVQRKRGVPNPDVSVVPVPHPPHLNGNRCGGGGDEASGGIELQQLEVDCRPGEGVPVPLHEPSLADPVSPKTDDLVFVILRVAGAEAVHRVLEDQLLLFPLGYLRLEEIIRAPPVDTGSLRQSQQDIIIPFAGPQLRTILFELQGFPGVIPSGDEDELRNISAPNTLDLADEYMPGTLFYRPRQHVVDYGELGAVLFKAVLEDCSVFYIRGVSAVSLRFDGEVPPVSVQHPGEDRVGIESGHTQPVDRAVDYQSGGVEITGYEEILEHYAGCSPRVTL